MSYAYKHFTFLRLWHSLFSSTSLLFSKYWHSFFQEIGIFSAELSNLKLQLMCTKWCHAAIKGDISLHNRLTFFFNWKKKTILPKNNGKILQIIFLRWRILFLLCFLDSWKADTFFGQMSKIGWNVLSWTHFCKIWQKYIICLCECFRGKVNWEKNLKEYFDVLKFLFALNNLSSFSSFWKGWT